MITPRPLPATALLASYQDQGAYTDCLSAEVPGTVSLAAYVQAFYCSAVFRPERVLIGALLGMKADNADVAALAAGSVTRFSAWTVEGREADQLLLCDFQSRTRSWLMVAPGEHPGTTRLHFGSAVIRQPLTGAARAADNLVFTALLGFHKLYARALLWGAVRALRG